MDSDLAFIRQMAEGYMAVQRIATIDYLYNSRKLIYQHDKVKLYHYKTKAKKVFTIPLLIVFATVNRPEILDLIPDHSFIGGLLQNGIDVYLLDWGYPTKDDQHISLGDYINYLQDCVQFIKNEQEKDKINLLGICQGGLITVCYAALYENIKNLILISTPIDFHTKDNIIAKMIKHLNINEMIHSRGNISGTWLTQFFIFLRPFELIGKKYLRFTDHLEDAEWTEKFLRVEKWLHDAPDQTAISFKELIEDFYQKNKLIKGKFYIHGQKVNLENIHIPVFNLMARNDEIIPISASRKLKKYISSSDYSERIFPSGHIGIYVSENMPIKISKAIAAWLKEHNE